MYVAIGRYIAMSSVSYITYLVAIGPYVAFYSDDDIVVGGYSIPVGAPVVFALGLSLRSERMLKSS